jgi:hypothetical protein
VLSCHSIPFSSRLQFRPAYVQPRSRSAWPCHTHEGQLAEYAILPAIASMGIWREGSLRSQFRGTRANRECIRELQSEHPMYLWLEKRGSAQHLQMLDRVRFSQCKRVAIMASKPKQVKK